MYIETTGLSVINESQEVHYIIYKITNNINGKYYIGQHVTSNPNDSYHGSGQMLKKAFKKYGIENFTKQILMDCSSQTELDEMEFEYVQLSNCYPYDKMSYNITVGGNGGSKFIGKTEDEKQEIFNRVRETINNFPEEKKIELRRIQSENTKRFFQKMTDEERINFGRNISKKQFETWKSRTPEQRKKISEKTKRTKSLYDNERKNEIYQKLLNTLSKRTDEEKKTIGQNISLSRKKMFESMTPEEINRMTNQKKRMETLRNKPESEKIKSIEKWRKSIMSKTKEQKMEITRKRLESLRNRSIEEQNKSKTKRKETLLNKSESEKNETIKKISNSLKENYRKHPELKRKHSQAMKGSGNPVFGKKLMTNLTTNKSIYVSKEEIESYLKNGWVLGHL